MTCAADMTMKPVDWLVGGWLPESTLAVFAGDNGVGKSTMCADLAAAVSRGDRWNNQDVREGHVLVWTDEEAFRVAWLPRLDDAGADMSRIHALHAKDDVDDEIDISGALDRVEALLIAHPEIRLFVVDTLKGVLPSGADPNGKGVRPVLIRLRHMAKRSGTAIVGILHFHKPGEVKRSASDRVSGTREWTNVPRAAWVIERAGEGDGQISALFRAKNSYGTREGGYRFHIEGGTVRDPDTGREMSTQRIVWGDRIPGMVEDFGRDVDPERMAQDDFVLAAIGEGDPAGIAWADVEAIGKDSGYTPKNPAQTLGTG